jgi:hypothetical protein
MIRGQIVNSDTTNRGQTVVVSIRAGSKTGAMLSSRLNAIRTIPLREQEVISVESVSNERFLDRWEVEISDQRSMSNI